MHILSKLQKGAYNRRFFLLYILLLLTFLASSCRTGSNVTSGQGEKWITIRVLTYNIFHGETTSGEINMDLFANIINKFNPDLVALQEVDKSVGRSNYLDITNELSQRTGLDGYFIEFRDYKEGEYGVAILSKYPIKKIDIIEAYSSSVYRTLSFAKVEIRENEFIYFNSSHLSTIDKERRKEIKQLVEYYNNELEHNPLIIAGDLNANPYSPGLDILLAQFEISDKKLLYTFSTRTGMRKKIDYILYPDNATWKVLDTKRACREDASDHCALLSILKYKINLP